MQNTMQRGTVVVFRRNDGTFVPGYGTIIRYERRYGETVYFVRWDGSLDTSMESEHNLLPTVREA